MTTKKPDVAAILRKMSPTDDGGILDVAEEVLQIEERAQFAENRVGARSRIAERVSAFIEKSELAEG